ncbi:hypothetical protein [Bradyrhizobium liaoningense]|uniref:hypothetical protein n=1 Tax=Bradyrhizobium liaoningense TaxID=43992 RepID=UPI001BA7696F|nr:hypothetical protein [Bradyrhizobium liaoningense]MBR0822750.1 hypothetical protein [Bradyrhizobium liaoningense]
MTSSNSLRTLTLAGAGALLLGTAAQAGPIPTHLSTMKSMVDQTTTEVRWVGGWRGGYGYRGVGWGYRGGGGYRGGWGYRGYGYRGLGYGVAAGAVVGGAIARSAYYGGYGGSYGGYYGGYPAYGNGYSYPAASYYGYGGGDYGSGYFDDNCAPSGSYWAY